MYVYRRFTIHYSTSFSEALFSFVDTKLSHKILSPKSAFLHQSKFPRREYTENDVYYCVLKKTERIKMHKRQMIYTLFLARRTKERNIGESRLKEQSGGRAGERVGGGGRNFTQCLLSHQLLFDVDQVDGYLCF